MKKILIAALMCFYLVSCSGYIPIISSSSSTSSEDISSSLTSENDSDFSEESSSTSEKNSSYSSSGKSEEISSISSTTSSTTSSNSSSDFSSSSSTGSSSSSSSTSSTNSSSLIEKYNIKKIKEKAKEFIGLENSVGVYESNVKVSLNLKMLACLDAITTKSGYGDRYKILMTDGEDYIYVKTTQKNYEYLKKYVANKGVYKINGNISLYNNEVEITMKEDITYLENENLVVDYNDISTSKSLYETYQLMNNLKLNCKGVGYSEIVKVKVKCLAKDINNTNMYFGNGDYIINVHGHDKVTNGFTVGSSYTLYGALNMYNFRPGLEYVHHEASSTSIEFDVSNLQTMKASDFYKFKYETDKDSTYPNYSKLFEKPVIVEGYANSYTKDGKEYVVLDEKYNENYYNTYQNAMNAKAIFFANENYVKLTSSNSKYCPMYEHIERETKLKVIVFPYLWNTQKYPEVYCFAFEEIE